MAHNKLTVTLAALRKQGACLSGYNKVVRALQGKPFTDGDAERETHIRFAHKEPIPITFILNSNGIDDALWSLRCIENAGRDRDIRLFGIWCARQVEHLMIDKRSKAALDVAERHANGKATDDELDAARDAAMDAARAAALASAWAAARAAARDEAWAAARAAALASAWDEAWDEARAAARAAALASAWAAARAAARDEARAAARDEALASAWAAARAAQAEMLIKMCKGDAPWQPK